MNLKTNNMNQLNLVLLIGNVSRIPKFIKISDSEHEIITFLLKTNDYGVKKDDVEWHEVRFLTKYPDNYRHNLCNGQKVIVTGQIKTDKWEDEKTGAKKTSKIINAKSVTWEPGQLNKENQKE